MDEAIRKILEIAVHAPSGHNYQPWKFSIQGNMVSLFNIPERDTTIFNFRQRGSFVAHGAVIENISLAAPAFGYMTKVVLFPEPNNKELTARITFEQSVVQKNPLSPFIEERVTNRKPYKIVPLQDDHRAALLATSTELQKGNVHLVEDPSAVKELAKVFTLNERLVLENFHMHQSLFPHILWSKKEDEQKKIGLYLKTFELPPPGQMMFRFLKHWQVAKIVSKLGMPKMVMAQNQKLYSASSAIGLISMDSNSENDFLSAGRLMQRVWLKATKMGISIQPVAGLLYLGHRILSGDQQYFTTEQSNFIEDGYMRIAKIFNVKQETMMMTFRIGYDEQPSARAQKIPPQYNTLKTYEY